jgi:hypothetical protein
MAFATHYFPRQCGSASAGTGCLRGTCTWLSQLIIFQDDAALLQRVLGACSDGQVLHLQHATIKMPSGECT